MLLQMEKFHSTLCVWGWGVGGYCGCSVPQSWLTLCNPMDCSTPGFPVLHRLPELAQTHVHWVSDANIPSHPLLYPFSPGFNLSQHQGLFSWVGSLLQVYIVNATSFQNNWGFPSGASGKEPACQCRRHKRCGFNLWVGKIPWRRKWQPTGGFLTGESHGQRSLVGYSPWGRKESDTTESSLSLASLSIHLLMDA